MSPESRPGARCGLNTPPGYDRLLVNRFEVRTLDAERGTPEPKGIMLRGSSDSTGQITVETNSGSFLISVSDLEVEKELEFPTPESA